MAQLGYPRPLRVGQFTYMANGPIGFKVDDLNPDNVYFGIPYSDLAWEIYLTDKDNNFYMNVNLASTLRGDQRAPLGGVGFGMQLISTPTGLIPDPELGLDTIWSADQVKVEHSPEHELKFIIPTERSPLNLIINQEKQTLVYKAGNHDIDLHGELVSPGLQFFLPWRQDDDVTSMMLYTGAFFSLAGHYHGREVTGYGMLSNIWSQQSYVSSWWSRNRVGTWMTWAATYDDGMKESGMIWYGEYGCQGSTTTNNKGETVLNTSDFIEELIDGPDGETGRIVYTYANGEQWELIVDTTRGNWRKLPGGTGPYITGVFKRVGEKRKLVTSYAIGGLAHKNA